MKKKTTIISFATEEEWMESRAGKITGTRAGNLVMKRGVGYKMGFWEMLAERVAIPPTSENVMDRGKRLEKIAIDRFVEKTKKKVNTDLVIMCRSDYPDIAYSPDGFIGATEDVEVKCLSSARHLETYFLKEIPSEYYDQIMQGFVVNDSLKKRYMVFYDPRCPVDMFYLEILRTNYKEEIKEMLKTQISILEEVKKLEEIITFKA